MPIYDDTTPYDSPDIEYDGGELWFFTPPVGLIRPFEVRPIFSIWTRVQNAVSSTVVQNNDLSWTQYDGAAPQTYTEYINVNYFGPRGFSGGNLGTITSSQMGFFDPRRVYLGGHRYVITDGLRSELLSAVTKQQPSGYGAFITPAPTTARPIGDEVILNGKFNHELPVAP